MQGLDLYGCNIQDCLRPSGFTVLEACNISRAALLEHVPVRDRIELVLWSSGYEAAFHHTPSFEIPSPHALCIYTMHTLALKLSNMHRQASPSLKKIKISMNKSNPKP